MINYNYYCLPALCINSPIAVSYYRNAYFGQGIGPIWLNYLYCTGSENSLLDCDRAYAIGYPYSCSHSVDVSIVCPGNIVIIIVVRLS